MQLGPHPFVVRLWLEVALSTEHETLSAQCDHVKTALGKVSTHRQISKRSAISLQRRQQVLFWMCRCLVSWGTYASMHYQKMMMAAFIQGSRWYWIAACVFLLMSVQAYNLMVYFCWRAFYFATRLSRVMLESSIDLYLLSLNMIESKQFLYSEHSPWLLFCNPWFKMHFWYIALSKLSCEQTTRRTMKIQNFHCWV